MAPPIQIEFGRRAMACQFQVIVNRDHPSSTPERAVQALDVISHYEQLLSVYIEASDLSRLNREGALRPIAIDPLVHDLLAQAKGLAKSRMEPTTLPPPRSLSRGGSLGGKGECLRVRRSNKPWRNADPIRSLCRSTLARPRFYVLEFKSIRRDWKGLCLGRSS